MQDTKGSEADTQLNCCTFQTCQSYLHQPCSQTFTSSPNCSGANWAARHLPHTICYFTIIGQFNATVNTSTGSTSVAPVGGLAYLLLHQQTSNKLPADPHKSRLLPRHTSRLLRCLLADLARSRRLRTIKSCTATHGFRHADSRLPQIRKTHRSRP